MHSVPSHSASKPHDSDYSRNRARSIRFLILLAAILALAFFLSLRAGSYNTPAAELIRGIFGRASDAKINLVIRNNRLPRICTAMVAGAGLGLAGCILQAVLRNPLASASTLGVSQGATFGAAVAIIGLGLSQAGSWAIPLCSFLGSLLVAAVILGLSRFKQVSSEGIVLAGVAISSMLTGATTLLQYFADEVALSSLVFWTFGDLGSTSWQSLRGMALAVLLLIVYCYLHRWDYNALLSGEETALSLGINVQRLTLTNVVLTCLVCSIIVSNVGLINFIGLVAPHIVRMVVGNNYIYLISGSVLAGAALLLLSDLVARVVIMPVILPIGALTAFLGGPLFLYLLFPLLRWGLRKQPLLTWAVVLAASLPVHYMGWDARLVAIHIPEFLLGMAYVHWKRPARLGVLAGCAVLLFTPAAADGKVACALFSAAAFILLATLGGCIHWVPLQNACALLSKYSYAVFLTHHVIILRLVDNFDLAAMTRRDTALLFGVYLLAVAAASAALFRLDAWVRSSAVKLAAKPE